MKLTEKEFNKIENPSYDLTGEDEQIKKDLYDAYANIQDLLKKYCDLKEDDYPIITAWIVGTYFHKEFESYPYLFLNAMKGSGKTRTLKLITDLAYEGEILIQPTEAVLFRTNSTLGIDEAEGIARKGTENLRELINGCYKRGSKVKRMKQMKTEKGTEQVVEEFDIYRPLALANINGMENVLGDRCINIVLERSNNKQIIKLAEIWKEEKIFKKTKEILEKCRVCNVVVAEKLYVEWNNYVMNTYINYNIYKLHTNNTHNTQLFKDLNLMDLTGREVELCLPLLYIAWGISKETYDHLHFSLKSYMKERKTEQFNESMDIMMIDMISQELNNFWQTPKEILRKYIEFTQLDEKDAELNLKWIGIALKRLNLIKEKKRGSGGMRYILNVEKAQEKIRMFK